MEKFNPSELCADIKIYDYKKKVKYDEKSLVIFEKTGKMIKAGKECEGMLYTLPANSIGFSPIVLGLSLIHIYILEYVEDKKEEETK